mmetsp:Transcript_28500/g.55813  ORF Transcript_28500/g.55813 Transcript_28500/m.55813 type:complete len:121 (-) Transcript_28500:193-555(-)
MTQSFTARDLVGAVRLLSDTKKSLVLSIPSPKKREEDSGAQSPLPSSAPQRLVFSGQDVPQAGREGEDVDMVEGGDSLVLTDFGGGGKEESASGFQQGEEGEGTSPYNFLSFRRWQPALT